MMASADNLPRATAGRAHSSMHEGIAHTCPIGAMSSWPFTMSGQPAPRSPSDRILDDGLLLILRATFCSLSKQRAWRTTKPFSRSSLVFGDARFALPRRYDFTKAAGTCCRGADSHLNSVWSIAGAAFPKQQERSFGRARDRHVPLLPLGSPSRRSARGSSSAQQRSRATGVKRLTFTASWKFSASILPNATWQRDPVIRNRVLLVYRKSRVSHAFT